MLSAGGQVDFTVGKTNSTDFFVWKNFPRDGQTGKTKSSSQLSNLHCAQASMKVSNNSFTPDQIMPNVSECGGTDSVT